MVRQVEPYLSAIRKLVEGIKTCEFVKINGICCNGLDQIFFAEEYELVDNDDFNKKIKDLKPWVHRVLENDKLKYELAREIDKILEGVWQNIEEANTLESSIKLLQYLGHRLKRVRGVCGYSFSGVFNKVEIRMLRDFGNQEKVKASIEETMKKYPKDFYGRKIEDLVKFVVIGKVPRLQLDFLPSLTLKPSQKMQTPGAFFEIAEELFLSTVSHGCDLRNDGFEICMEPNKAFIGQYKDSVYNEPQTHMMEDEEVAETGQIPDLAMLGVEAVCGAPEEDHEEVVPVTQKPDMKQLLKTSVLKLITNDDMDEPSNLSTDPHHAGRGRDVAGEDTGRGTEGGILEGGAVGGVSEREAAGGSMDTGEVMERRTAVNNKDRIDEDMETNAEAGARDGGAETDNFGNGNEGGRDESEADDSSHIDLCFIHPLAREPDRYLPSIPVGGYYVRVYSLQKANENHRNAEVQKIGAGTGLTKGRLVNIGSFVFRKNTDYIWVDGVLIIEQEHSYPEIEGAMVEDMDPTDFQRIEDSANPFSTQNNTTESLSENHFALPGDSGALITLRPPETGIKDVEAIGIHLYHYISNDNIYQKYLNYSVACHIVDAIDALKRKLGQEIRLRPTILYASQ